ncbi:hypothetical protein ACFE04_019687 [Oxalis oulophora]
MTIQQGTRTIVKPPPSAMIPSGKSAYFGTLFRANSNTMCNEEAKRSVLEAGAWLLCRETPNSQWHPKLILIKGSNPKIPLWMKFTGKSIKPSSLVLAQSSMLAPALTTKDALG